MPKTAPRLTRPRRHVHLGVGAYSRAGALSLLDGRSREAMYMRRVRADLTEHLGGSPNAVQRALIERAVRLSLKLELLDEQMMHGAIFGDRDDNCYLAWSNALSRTLSRIGIKAAAPRAKTLDDILDEQHEAAA